MAFEVITTSFRMKERQRGALHLSVIAGGTTAVLGWYICLMGLAVMFDGRAIVSGVFTLGQALVIGLPIAGGYFVASKTVGRPTSHRTLGIGIAGLIGGGGLALLLLLGEIVNLRVIFSNASPALMQFLSLGLSLTDALVAIVAGGVTLAYLGATFQFAPQSVRGPVVMGIAVCLIAALMRDIVQLLLGGKGVIGTLHAHIFDWRGLTPHGAAELFVAGVLSRIFAPSILQRYRESVRAIEERSQFVLRIVIIGIGVTILLLLPLLAGPFVGQVLMLVVLFILMGLGLNIEVGLAGLLDLGFVAFYAIGAYTMALLTSTSAYAVADLSFWIALPISALVAALAGFVFGLPVLRVRGDYLAVATLGLGEIVRLLVLSELLKPSLGGSQGILGVPKPFIGGIELADPSHLVYVPIAACVVVAYCAWRLGKSRIGRAWIALREDEDVAQALGLDLIGIKLLAYSLGAAFAGVAGGIFAAMVGSVFPHSFQLIISINVLALIILGGMGSIPGVMVGALALVGIPELLREFGEFRFLFYGIVLVVMMRCQPEGLWPSSSTRRVRAILEEDQ